MMWSDDEESDDTVKFVLNCCDNAGVSYCLNVSVSLDSKIEYKNVSRIDVDVNLDNDEDHNDKNNKTTTTNVGTLKAYIVNRDFGNFLESCDAISQQLHEFSVLCKHNKGHWGQESTKGGVFFIDDINIKKEFRGQDLALSMVRALFDAFLERFTLMALLAVPWDIEDQDRRQVDPERNAKKNTIGRHFGRLGFRQIRKTGYMFLERSNLLVKNLALDEVPALKFDKTPEPLDPDSVDAQLVQHIDSVPKLRELLDAGADPNKARALHYAAANGCPEALQVMGMAMVMVMVAVMVMGMVMGMGLVMGMGMVMVMVMGMVMVLLQVLLQHGVDVNGEDETGTTALGVAAATMRLECISMLLEAGANPLLCDGNGDTPLQVLKASIVSIDDFLEAFGMRDLVLPEAVAAKRREEKMNQKWCLLMLEDAERKARC